MGLIWLAQGLIIAQSLCFFPVFPLFGRWRSIGCHFSTKALLHASMALVGGADGATNVREAVSRCFIFVSEMSDF